MGRRILNGLELVEQDAPSAPAAGVLAVYAKAGGVLAVKDDAGVETELGAAGAGADTEVRAALGVPGENDDGHAVLRDPGAAGDMDAGWLFVGYSSGFGTDVAELNLGVRDPNIDGAGLIQLRHQGGQVGGGDSFSRIHSEPFQPDAPDTFVSTTSLALANADGTAEALVEVEATVDGGTTEHAVRMLATGDAAWVELTDIAAPPTPETGRVALFALAGSLWKKDDAGVETELGAGGTGGESVGGRLYLHANYK